MIQLGHIERFLRWVFAFLRRRGIFILIPAIIVGAYALLKPLPELPEEEDPRYLVEMRFMVGQEPFDTVTDEETDRLAIWKASEYVVGGLADYVRSTHFAREISADLAAQGVDVPYEDFWEGISSNGIRSSLKLVIEHDDEEEVVQMMESAIRVLTAKNGELLPQLGGVPAQLLVLNDIEAQWSNEPPDAPERPPVLPQVIPALLAGFMLACVIEFLDPTIYSRGQLEAADFQVLAEIPKR